MHSLEADIEIDHLIKYPGTAPPSALSPPQVKCEGSKWAEAWDRGHGP